MSYALPTVAIQNPDKPGEKIIINEADFDPEKHRLFEKSSPPKAAEMVTPEESQETEDATPDDGLESTAPPIRRGRASKNR